MTIGQKLTALRKARGMTQEELSEAIGVTARPFPNGNWTLLLPTLTIFASSAICSG